MTRGLGSAGALFVSGCGGNDDRVFHDTYFVVYHGPAMAWFASVVLLTPVLWWIIQRLTGQTQARLRRVFLTIWAFSIAAVVSPLLILAVLSGTNTIWGVAQISRLAAIGATGLNIAAVGSLLVCFWVLFRWIAGRR
jgi:heme/copper-type cytochrome/quinol oxidase subunit 1